MYSTENYDSHLKWTNMWFKLENKIEAQLILLQTKTKRVVTKGPLQVLRSFNVTAFLLEIYRDLFRGILPPGKSSNFDIKKQSCDRRYYYSDMVTLSYASTVLPHGPSCACDWNPDFVDAANRETEERTSEVQVTVQGCQQPAWHTSLQPEVMSYHPLGRLLFKYLKFPKPKCRIQQDDCDLITAVVCLTFWAVFLDQ